ncbi:MAG: hypothetical protein Q8S43_07410 [Actinomycetota bacterium]|nr:MAG: hypothetical protein FD171_356 [Actinomycetota bacterium]MDO8950269.1 hypothetical protein [Actinomycetota bacterium]MDP3630761.1 hypothetical protein [Actinomycetota bacterium]
MKRMMITMMAVVLAAAVILPVAATAASSGSTAVTGHVATRASVTATDTGILVQANTEWTLVMETASGDSTYTGGHTSGTSIPLPEDTAAYWIITE